MDRASMSQPSLKKGYGRNQNNARTNISQPATSGILPIISVGSSVGSVEFQNSGSTGTSKILKKPMAAQIIDKKDLVAQDSTGTDNTTLQ